MNGGNKKISSDALALQLVRWPGGGTGRSVKVPRIAEGQSSANLDIDSCGCRLVGQ